MHIKMIFGPGAGNVIDAPDDEAVRLISGRWAVPVAPPVERAVKTVQETRGPVENNAGGRSGGAKKKRGK
jgi:hypothetical protein